MLLQSPLFLILTGLSTLLFFAAGQALTPGSYFIVNVGNGLRVLTGSSPGVPLAQEGVPLGAFPTPDTEILSNHIFTINSAMTTMFNEEAQQFVVVDASDGGSAGSGIILCNTTFPVPPFIPIGNSDWSFVQGSEGTIIQLSGRNLAWSLLSTAFGTQITLQTLNPSDLRQQWFFTAHSLV